MIDLNELRRLAQAATSGGWYVERGKYVYGCKDVTDGEEEWHPVIACTDDDETNVNFEGNAAFIAAANPTTISELLDRLEAAEKAVTAAYRRGYATGQEEIAAELEFAKREIANLHDDIHELTDERDALRAEWIERNAFIVKLQNELRSYREREKTTGWNND